MHPTGEATEGENTENFGGEVAVREDLFRNCKIHPNSKIHPTELQGKICLESVWGEGGGLAAKDSLNSSVFFFVCDPDPDNRVDRRTDRCWMELSFNSQPLTSQNLYMLRRNFVNNFPPCFFAPYCQAVQPTLFWRGVF